MAWLRNKKTGGWFQVPDEELKKETNQYMNDKIRAKGKTLTERIDSLENEVQNAKTSKQVLEILKKNKIPYKEYPPMESDRVPKTKALDVEMDNGYRRIYYSPMDKSFILQKRQKVEYIPTGTKRKMIVNENTYAMVDDYKTKVTKR